MRKTMKIATVIILAGMALGFVGWLAEPDYEIDARDDGAKLVNVPYLLPPGR